MNIKKLAKLIVALPLNDIDPTENEDLDFRSSEDPMPDQKWRQQQPHDDSPCYKYPCTSKAFIDFGPLKENGVYTILGEDEDHNLIVNHPYSSGTLKVPLSKRLPKQLFKPSFEGVFKPRVLDPEQIKRQRPLVYINVDPKHKDLIDEGPWYVVEYMGEKSRVRHAELPDDPRAAGFLAPNTLLRAAAPFTIGARYVKYQGKEYNLKMMQKISIKTGTFPEYVQPAEELREENKQKNIERSERSESTRSPGGKTGISRDTEFTIRGRSGKYLLWGQPGKITTRLLPVGQEPLKQNTVMANSEDVIDPEGNTVRSDVVKNTRSLSLQTQPAVKAPPIVILSNAWMQHNKPSADPRSKFYVVAGTVGGQAATIYPIELGITPSPEILELHSFRVPTTEATLLESKKTLAEVRQMIMNQRKASLRVSNKLALSDWSEPINDLYFWDSESLDALMFDQEFGSIH